MEDKMTQFIKDLAADCVEKGIKTAKKVYKNIFDIVWADYKGKAPKKRIEAVCDDLTESVCLEMGIPHDC